MHNVLVLRTTHDFCNNVMYNTIKHGLARRPSRLVTNLLLDKWRSAVSVRLPYLGDGSRCWQTQPQSIHREVLRPDSKIENWRAKAKCYQLKESEAHPEYLPVLIRSRHNRFQHNGSFLLPRWRWSKSLTIAEPAVNGCYKLDWQCDRPVVARDSPYHLQACNSDDLPACHLEVLEAW